MKAKTNSKRSTRACKTSPTACPISAAFRVRKAASKAIEKNLSSMGRSIDIAYGKPMQVIGGIGSLERNKSGGLIKENSDILSDLQAPLKLDPVPTQTLAVLPSYPRMIDDLALTEGDMIRSLDAARSGLALLDTGLGDLDTFIKRLARTSLDFGGDISLADYNALVPLMAACTTSLGHSAVAGSEAEQLYNEARSRQLQTRITMLSAP